MDKLSKVFILAGLFIIFVAEIMIDSEGINGYLIVLCGVLGGAVAGAGCILEILYERKVEERWEEFFTCEYSKEGEYTDELQFIEIVDSNGRSTGHYTEREHSGERRDTGPRGKD